MVGSSTMSGMPSCLLDLLVGDGDGPEVGDGRGHHDDVGGRRCAPARPAPSRRRSSTCTTLDAGGDGPVDRGDEGDLRRRAERGLFGDGVALLARRSVGDEPHRVDRLAGAAGGDEHAQAGRGRAG